MSLTPITQPFVVDQDLNGGGANDRNVIVKALTDGGFAVAWVEDNADGQRHISVRKFDANGNPVSDETRITGIDRDNDFRGSGFNFPSIAALPNGGFAVEYNDAASGINNADGSPSRAFWTVVATFSAGGVLQSQTLPAGRPDNMTSIFSSSIVENGDGGYHYAYIQVQPTRLNVNGVQVAAEGQIRSSAVAVADFGDGAFVAYQVSDSQGSNDVAGRIITGGVSSAEFAINMQTNGSQTFGLLNQSIATLSNGSVVVAWTDDSSADVRARIFGSDGQPVTGEITLSNTPDGVEGEVAIAAMSSGRFIAIWREEGRITAQIFSSTGERLGEQSDLGIDAGQSLAVTVLTGDKVAVAWGDGVNAQVFQAPAAPIADHDAYETAKGESLTVGAANGVLVGDVDPDGGTLTAFLKTGPSNGNLTLNGDGSFTYTPSAGFSGKDSFTYAASDGGIESTPATVTITVEAPVQVQSGQTYDLAENKSFTGTLSDYNETTYQPVTRGSATNFVIAVLQIRLAQLEASDVGLKVGSVNVNIDGNGDGVADTVFTFADPAPNVTFEIVQQGEDSVISVRTLAQSTAGDDTITGTDNPDYIAGSDGNDVLNGGGGSDALVGGAGSDTLSGGVGADDLVGGDGADTLDGGAGADTMKGGAGSDIYIVDNAGDVVTEAAGEGDADEVRTTLSTYQAPAGVEKVTYDGTASGKLRGNDGNNVIVGSEASDLFLLQDGGDDIATGLGGDDGFYFGAALTAADEVDGGEGTLDQVGLQGNYSGLTLGAKSLVGIEQLVFLPGSNTRFGDTSGSFYDYNVTTLDTNVAAGQRLVVTFNTLRVGEDVTFNGSAETDGYFLTYGGFGADILTGGQQDDAFFFGRDGRFGAGDRVDGQGGSLDQLGLQGDYTGVNAVVFGADQIKNVEQIVLLTGGDTRFGGAGGGYSYDLTMNDGNVLAGGTLVITANRLASNETLTFDGSAELDGRYRVFSGDGNDTITGGAGGDELFGRGGVDRIDGGAGSDRIIGGLGGDFLTGGDGGDTFVYASAAESTSVNFDTLIGFDYNEDRVDLPSDAPAFSDVVQGGRLDSATFDDDLAAALNGVMGAGEAAVFIASQGSFAGRTFGIVDANGIAGYQAGEDFVFELVEPVVPGVPTTDFFI
jgi:Ca2+-binding RTX toxin-like protein